MIRCHVCGRDSADHAPDCRLIDNLRRFDRVYRRLAIEGRNEALQARLLVYLNRSQLTDTAA
jgi:hypothetical protein